MLLDAPCRKTAEQSDASMVLVLKLGRTGGIHIRRSLPIELSIVQSSMLATVQCSVVKH